ncbi:MAG: hypothetical protein P1P64_04480 [Treponemataceae bacterium]
MLKLGLVTFVFFTLGYFLNLKNSLESHALILPPPHSIKIYLYILGFLISVYSVVLKATCVNAFFVFALIGITVLIVDACIYKICLLGETYEKDFEHY